MKKFSFLLIAAFVAVVSAVVAATNEPTIISLFSGEPVEMGGSESITIEQSLKNVAVGDYIRVTYTDAPAPATARMQNDALNLDKAKLQLIDGSGEVLASKEELTSANEYVDFEIDEDLQAKLAQTEVVKLKGEKLTVTAIDLYTFAAEPSDEHIWVAAEQGYENAQTITDITITNGVTGKFEKADGSNEPKYYTTGTSVRTYAGNTFTITSTEKNIVMIIFTFDTSKVPSLESDPGKVTISDAEGTWVGKAKEIVFSVPSGQTRIQKIQLFFEGEDLPEVPEEEGLVTLPEGVEAEDYTLVATQYVYSSSADDFVPQSREETAKVAFDGNDVYVSGLAYWGPEGFVKGTLGTDGKVTFKSGQLIWEEGEYKAYLIGIVEGEEEDVICDYVFDFDAEARTLTLAEGYLIGESDDPEEEMLYTFVTSAIYTPGAIELPDVVTPPEGAEAETWYFSGYTALNNGTDANYEEVGVVITENEIYIQGLCAYLPEAWVKGTIDGTTVTFANGQFLGQYLDKYNFYFVGTSDGETTSDMVFDYDAENGVLTSEDLMVIQYASPQALGSVTDAYYNVEIVRTKPEPLDPIVAPENLQTEEYQFTASEMIYDSQTGEASYEDYSTTVLVGFDGNNIYIQGMNPYLPEAWIMGTVDGATVTIPSNQFMGIFTYNNREFETFFSAGDPETGDLLDAVFTIDQEAGTLTSEQVILINGDRNKFSYWNWYENVVLTKKNDASATPADPSFAKVNLKVTYPNVEVVIPSKDTEGNDLLTSKLSYQFFVKTEEAESALTLTKDLYTKLDADMTEIPYSFADGLDIESNGDNKKVYLNQDKETVISTWEKIGVQSIYNGGGEVTKSNVVWYDIESGQSETGISGVNAANENAVYFNLQGRAANANAKGLLIKQIRNQDGTTNTLKVFRK